MTIQQAIQRLQKKTLQHDIAKVVSVGANTCVVAFEDGRADLPDVRLKAVVDDNLNQILIKPKVGSYVIIGSVGDFAQSQRVVGYSEVDSVSLKIQGLFLNFDQNGYYIARGDENLHALITDLTAAVNSLNNAVKAITLNTNVGPTVPTPINNSAFVEVGNLLDNITSRISNLLKDAE